MPLLLRLWLVAQESPWRPLRPQSHLIRNLGLDELRQQDERLLPAKIARLGGNDSGHPSWTTVNSVPHDTIFKVTVVTISPGKFGSSTEQGSCRRHTRASLLSKNQPGI